MAYLEHVAFQPWRESVVRGCVGWELDKYRSPIPKLPQIFWDDGSGWSEANLWVMEKIYDEGRNLQTAESLAKHLSAYACFLELKKLDWRHFPVIRSERSLTRFRGYLIKQRELGELAPSTARARMAACIQFYRFAARMELIAPTSPMWRDIPVTITFHDFRGFRRALERMSTDLSIPNTGRPGFALEDGLTPLSEANLEQLLKYSYLESTPELHLMLTVGCLTGARLQSIASLHIEDLEAAVPDPYMLGISLIRAGPGTRISTKGSVSGDLLFPNALLESLKKYAYSNTRLKREAKATSRNKSLVFLTSRGNPYSNSAMGVLMSALRKSGTRANIQFMKNLKFHQTRATFGSWLMTIALSVTTAAAALAFVRAAMLHKKEATTFTYIKFLEVNKAKQEVAKKFHEAFTGLHNRQWDEFDT